MPVSVTRQKVALDARRAVRPMTGIGHYILELAKRMPALAPELEFQLLVDRPLPEGVLSAGCTQVVLGRFVGDFTPVARFHSPLWLNTLVPLYIRQNGIALFHGTNSVIPLLPSCRAVCTVHDVSFVEVPNAYGPVYRSYMRAQVHFALRRADVVVSGSCSARKDMTELLHISGDKVVVIHHGVGEEFRAEHDDSYLRRVRSQFELPKRYILHVGIVEVKKGIDTLLQASASVIRAGLADAVVIAGRDGFGSREIRGLAYDLGLGDKVSFLGFVPQELLPGLYALASAVAFSSRYEGFGLPVLEAMASGVPVVASESSSIPEVAGDAAILVPLGDAGKLVEALRSVLGSAELSAELRRRGLSRVKQFTWTESAARHVAVYRQILGLS
jgi:glycosyltransferase involved in cell wall biosynthesis